MGIEEIFSRRKKYREDEGRKNDGGNFMAVPPQAPGDITKEELNMLYKHARNRRDLESKIVEIESDPNHPQQDQLEELREQLRDMIN